MWSVNGELFFCMACGCHARKQVKDLALRCNQRPTSGAERSPKLLRNGVDPTSKKEVGVPFAAH
eukprot:3802960-Pyramimonas_sp.AAC.1